MMAERGHYHHLAIIKTMLMMMQAPGNGQRNVSGSGRLPRRFPQAQRHKAARAAPFRSSQARFGSRSVESTLHLTRPARAATW